ncbi:hypothetical protein SUNI508_11967 [Seiridium unicorne]|uniref:Hydantoinase B/oxoprolinase domain-containing protein n=1 Tax=Seiridium unicorne TaxID=138068 RepID=A0ABR2UF78_9PEZI
MLRAGTILPSRLGAATIGGNVATRQFVTDLVVRASQAAAASEGTCNNLTFRFGGWIVEGKAKPGFRYYETIAGGADVGPTWAGQSGVNVHITNTRIVDLSCLSDSTHDFCETSALDLALEAGRIPSGNGLIRDIEFRVPSEGQCSEQISHFTVIQAYGRRAWAGWREHIDTPWRNG